MNIADRIDALWNFQDPSASEGAFRVLADERTDVGDRACAMTQVARALGLQRRFDEARAMLDEAAALVPTEPRAEAHARLALERGRVENSSGNKTAARPHFEEALRIAEAIGDEPLAVDAAHMIAIIASGREAIEWNERALAMADAAKHPRARRWQASLLNNLGWSQFDSGNHPRALELFERTVELHGSAQRTRQWRIARWSVARVLRAIGQYEDALARQQALRAEMAADNAPDGYVEEEIGECLLALRRESQSIPHFAEAYRILSADPWVVANEAPRLARLRELSGEAERAGR